LSFAREGLLFIAIAAVIAAGAFGFAIYMRSWGLWLLAFVLLLLALWVAYFFRDPERVTPLRDGLVISPADGRVSAVDSVIPPPELDLDRDPVTRISFFMNVFDVHINRSPVDARIARMAYIPGLFVNADLDKASEDNERQALTLEMPNGTRIGVVQIAGLIARRIVKFVEEGDRLVAGQRFGMIRFGSRVDVYLPKGVNSFVSIGQRTIAGETVLADCNSSETERMARRG